MDGALGLGAAQNRGVFSDAEITTKAAKTRRATRFIAQPGCPSRSYFYLLELMSQVVPPKARLFVLSCTS
jgi:hypothetical protein